jgi:prolycopene isomerase
MSQQNKELSDRYDVVIIGAGMGGSTCGAVLAKEGLSVLVAEQHSKPGGYCTSFQRKGFTFGVGLGWLTGAGKGEIIPNTLEELGLKDAIEFIELNPAMRVMGSDYNLPMIPFASHTDEWKRMFPDEEKNIDAFGQDCKALVSEMIAMGDLAPDLLGFVGKMGLMKKFLFNCPALKKYGKKAFKEAIDKSFKDPKLKVILGSFFPPDVGAVGLMCFGFPPPHYPKGGFQALSDVFTRGLTKHGGKLVFKTMVTKILIEKGKAVGAELEDGTKIHSRYVVSNVDAKQTFFKLVGKQHLNQKYIKGLEEPLFMPPNFLVSLGVDMDFKAMGFDSASLLYNRSDNLDDIFSGDPDKCSFAIEMHSFCDLSHALEGMATVQISALFPYNYKNYWKREKDGTRGEEYKKLKETVAYKLISAAEEVIPELSKHIICKDIATPLTFERYTLNSEGAIGWFPSPGAKMRSQKTPIKYLYQAGHWTFPGSGIDSVISSGRNAAQLVLKDMR